jgi:prepilin-type N-terminal cleavage/methylation domain-containing protein
MHRVHVHKGFTLIEVLVVIAILISLSTIGVGTFKNMREHSALRIATEVVFQEITFARSNTLASANDTVYGVRVASTSVIRFTGQSYTPTSTSNRVTTFDEGVTATGSLVSSGTSIVFARLTGEASASGTIMVRDKNGEGTTTIQIFSSGLVKY